MFVWLFWNTCNFPPPVYKASEHDQGTKPIKSNSSQFPHLWDESHTVNNEEWIAEVNSSQSICLAWRGKCNQTRCSIIQLDARSLSRNKECRLQLHSGGLRLGKCGMSGGHAGNQVNRQWRGYEDAYDPEWINSTLSDQGQMCFDLYREQGEVIWCYQKY